MAKKVFLSVMVLAFLIAVSGCNTIKGASEGAAQGAKQDWNDAKKVDDWMKKNLW